MTGTSRRRRKRERARREATAARSCPILGGEVGAAPALDRTDLRLIRRAVRQNWPVDPAKRSRIASDVRLPRTATTAFLTLLAMQAANSADDLEQGGRPAG